MLRGHAIITFAVKRRRGVYQKVNVCEQEMGCHVMRTFAYKFFQMKNLFHKLLAILTRFFAIFIKIPVLLLKCLFQKNFYLSFGIELNRIFEFPLKRNMLLLKYTTYFYEICICIKITTHIFVTTNQVLRKIQSAFRKYLDELKIKSCCS